MECVCVIEEIDVKEQCCRIKCYETQREWTIDTPVLGLQDEGNECFVNVQLNEEQQIVTARRFYEYIVGIGLVVNSTSTELTVQLNSEQNKCLIPNRFCRTLLTQNERIILFLGKENKLILLKNCQLEFNETIKINRGNMLLKPIQDKGSDFPCREEWAGYRPIPENCWGLAIAIGIIEYYCRRNTRVSHFLQFIQYLQNGTGRFQRTNQRNRKQLAKELYYLYKVKLENPDAAIFIFNRKLENPDYLSLFQQLMRDLHCQFAGRTDTAFTLEIGSLKYFAEVFGVYLYCWLSEHGSLIANIDNPITILYLWEHNEVLSLLYTYEDCYLDYPQIFNNRAPYREYKSVQQKDLSELYYNRYQEIAQLIEYIKEMYCKGARLKEVLPITEALCRLRESLNATISSADLQTLLRKTANSLDFIPSESNCETCIMSSAQNTIQDGIMLQCKHQFCAAHFSHAVINPSFENLITGGMSNNILECTACKDPLSISELFDIMGDDIYLYFERLRVTIKTMPLNPPQRQDQEAEDEHEKAPYSLLGPISSIDKTLNELDKDLTNGFS